MHLLHIYVIISLQFNWASWFVSIEENPIQEFDTYQY